MPVGPANGSTVAVYVHSVPAVLQFVVTQGSASVPEPEPCTVSLRGVAASTSAATRRFGVVSLRRLVQTALAGLLSPSNQPSMNWTCMPWLLMIDHRMSVIASSAASVVSFFINNLAMLMALLWWGIIWCMNDVASDVASSVVRML